jgi:hypothetical protein
VHNRNARRRLCPQTTPRTKDRSGEQQKKQTRSPCCPRIPASTDETYVHSSLPGRASARARPLCSQYTMPSQRRWAQLKRFACVANARSPRHSCLEAMRVRDATDRPNRGRMGPSLGAKGRANDERPDT